MQAKWQFYLFLGAIVWWLLPDGHNGKKDPPPLPPPIEKLLYLLDLGKYVVKKDGNQSWLKDHNNNIIPFSPVSFVKENRISTISDVKRVNQQITNDLRQCTDEILNKNRSSSSPQMHLLRAECLERKGYNENDLAYTRVKFNI
ncbi:MAG: hypothetical protein KAH84_02315 [Thiomargarita sp.]|nr:hypothetical protein [Thiomargarita sp.]